MPAPTAVNRSETSSATSRPRESVMGPVMSSLGWPIVIGLTGFWAFLMALDKGVIKSDILVRYLSAHFVSYVATGMFFVGMAALILKFFQVAMQIMDKGNIGLSPASALAQRPEASRHLLEELDQLSSGRQDSYLGRRLRNALEFVDKTESANGLEDELKYLADLDAERQQESFALTRILIWAIPMLGFLGTVIGISGALGGLSVEADFNMMLTGLKEKLYVAFDTTALALTLSIVLMFAQFVVNRFETQLLTAVDEKAAEELSGRFVTFGSNRDPYLASVENMSNRVLECMNDISKQQADVWVNGITKIQETTDATLGKFAETLADRLSRQLDPVMDEFGIALRKAISDSTAYLEQHGEKLTEAMKGSSDLIEHNQQEIANTVSQNHEALKNVVSVHAEGMQNCLNGAESILQQHLQQIHGVMNQTVELVSDQSQQLSIGIENSRDLMQSNADALNQAVESSDQLMKAHAGHLQETLELASQSMDEHSKKISDAILQSEEVVDRRQQTIAQTQESMLKAQTQQSMAIASFSDKLQSLQELMEKADSLEKIQTSVDETMDSMERSESLASEIRGLSRLVREQVKTMDQLQLSQAETADQNASTLMSHSEQIMRQYTELVDRFQQQMSELLDRIPQSTSSINDPIDAQPLDNLEKNLQALTMQLVNHNQSLTSLGEKLQSSLDLNDLSRQLEEAISKLAENPQSFQQLGDRLEAVTTGLSELQQTFLQPTEHQETFLNQQKQTIENQNQLLELCKGMDADQKSIFMETADQLLESHGLAVGKTTQLEQTVRGLANSLSQLNQVLATQINRAAESSLNLGKPDTPKRVA